VPNLPGMIRRRSLLAIVSVLALAAGAPAAFATTGSSTVSVPLIKVGPHFFPALTDSAAQRAALNPPALPCPPPLSSISVSPLIVDCHLGELPATGLPLPGNMAYYGGAVQTTPHIYLVFWGWGQSGAFPNRTCSSETLAEPGIPSATLTCDPDGAGKRMADFVSELGGTGWAGVQTQYYETVNGRNINITNPQNQLAGIWVDDADPIPANLTYTDMAQEAQRAAGYFGVSQSTLVDDNFVIAQPAGFSDPQAQSQGYCAFHDYTQPGLEGGIYNNVESGLAYTNMPYVLNQGSGCGENLVNAGAAGTLDGFTVALGHEIEETVTDPGAEDVLADGTQLGGWYDVIDSDENGDKCAYVGSSAGLLPGALPIPGAASDITGNRGDSFPVQSLWSNASAAGLGYCAGTANSLPF
jgi:hypothetical protein